MTNFEVGAIIIPLYTWGNWGTEKLITFPHWKIICVTEEIFVWERPAHRLCLRLWELTRTLQGAAGNQNWWDVVGLSPEGHQHLRDEEKAVEPQWPSRWTAGELVGSAAHTTTGGDCDEGGLDWDTCCWGAGKVSCVVSNMQFINGSGQRSFTRGGWGGVL